MPILSQERTFRWGSLVVLVANVICAALAWLLTPYVSPVRLADDSFIRGPFDVALCAFVVAGFAAFAVVTSRRHLDDPSDRWIDRARDLVFVAAALFFTRVCGDQAAESAGFLSRGTVYPQAPGSAPGWVWWALAAVCGGLAVVLTGLAFREDFRPGGRRTPSAASAASRRA
jgi:hypothetical protein